MRPLAILLSYVGLLLVAVFVVGYLMFVSAGSAGAPPPIAGVLLAGGGISYLLMILVAANIFARADDWRANEFANHASKNLTKTVIALICCVPAAFIFIGLIAPLFILPTSAILLAKAALRME